jgi:hypothetical protein
MRLLDSPSNYGVRKSPVSDASSSVGVDVTDLVKSSFG